MTGIADLPAAGWLPLEAGPGVMAASSCISLTPGMISLPDVRVITARQIHSANVAIVDGSEDEIADTDALITRESGVAVAVRTADCVPIVLNAPNIGAVAAVHAGWRGTIAGIVKKTLEILIKSGSSAADIYAAIGPHICSDCYEVSPELAEEFATAGYSRFVTGEAGRRPHLNLGSINRQQLIDCGVPSAHVFMSPHCTLCTPGAVFPSYRRDATTRRLFTVIYRIKDIT